MGKDNHMAGVETGKRVRKQLMTRPGDSVVIDPKTNEVIERNGVRIGKSAPAAEVVKPAHSNKEAAGNA